MRTEAVDHGIAWEEDKDDEAYPATLTAIAAFCQSSAITAGLTHAVATKLGLCARVYPLKEDAIPSMDAEARIVLVEVRIMEGFEDLMILRKIRQARPLTPIVAMSGNQYPDFVEEVYQAGASDCISNDVDPVVLFHKLARLARMADAARLVEVQNDELMKEMQAQRQANEERLRAEQERSMALVQAEANRQTREILDNLGEGFFIVDATLRIGETVSRACERIFGGSIAGQIMGETLGLVKGKEKELKLALEQLFEDIMPMDVNLGLLPARVQTNAGLILDISYQPLLNGQGAPERVIVVVTDATQAVKAQERLANEAELNQCLLMILRHKEAFEEFLRDFLQDLTTVATTRERSVCLRFLHTLKGNSATFKLSSLAQAIHAYEDRLQDINWERWPAAEQQQMADEIKQIMLDFCLAHKEILALNQGVARSYRVEQRQVDELQRLAMRLPEAEKAQWEQALHSLREVPVATLMSGFAETVARLAERQEKDVRFHVTNGDLRVDPERFRPLFNALIHAIRNACDHGIESMAEREAGGKVAQAMIHVAFAHPTPEQIDIVIADDGRGIDMDKLTEKALAMGLIQANDLPLDRKKTLGLLFADGLSTRDTVSETSGRGVGMSCIRDEVRKLGGSIRMATVPQRGTKLMVTVPRRR